MSKAKTKPIIFSGPMVRAILEGRKTQTRRVVKPQPKHQLIDGLAHVTRGMDPADDGAVWYDADCVNPGREVRPTHRPGDLLWVRETWAPVWPGEGYAPLTQCNIEYRADNPGATRAGGWDNAPDDLEAIRWRPSIHMPRWASRITLEVVSVRAEQVQDISPPDIVAEGAATKHDGAYWGVFPDGERWAGHREAFERLWNSINAKRGYDWRGNPWVWVIEFQVVTPEPRNA